MAGYLDWLKSLQMQNPSALPPGAPGGMPTAGGGYQPQAPLYGTQGVKPVVPGSQYQVPTTGGYDALLQALLSGVNQQNTALGNATFQGVQAPGAGAYSRLDPTATNAALSGLGTEVGGQLRGIADIYKGVGTGANDPRFQAYQNAQFNLMDLNNNKAQSDLAAELARTGVRGTAATNEMNRLNLQTGAQKQALAGQIGLEQLARQDTSLGNAANLFNNRYNLLAGGAQQMFGNLGTANAFNAGESQRGFGNEVSAAAFNNSIVGQGLETKNAAIQNIANALGIDTAHLAALTAGGQLNSDLLKQIQQLLIAQQNAPGGSQNQTPDRGGM